MRVMFGLLAAGILAGSIASAQAEDWCGFIDKEHSRVRCGFSSLDQCKHALGDKKDAYCIPDPTFASRERAGVRLAVNRF
jgi:Protein of unknown function (DUF3551)